MEKLRFVLDTSIFVNPDTRRDFGRTPAEALSTFLKIAKELSDIAEFYMPTSTYVELKKFVGESIDPSLEIYLKKKSPRKYEISIPAFFLYELVDDIRRRIDKGLRVAENLLKRHINLMELGVDVDRDLLQESIRKLRREYRKALREGIIDSKEDLDLIILAKELDATLVSVDYGVLAWAEKLGIKWIDPRKFRSVLESLRRDLESRKEAERREIESKLNP